VARNLTGIVWLYHEVRLIFSVFKHQVMWIRSEISVVRKLVAVVLTSLMVSQTANRCFSCDCHRFSKWLLIPVFVLFLLLILSFFFLLLHENDCSSYFADFFLHLRVMAALMLLAHVIICHNTFISLFGALQFLYRASLKTLWNDLFWTFKSSLKGVYFCKQFV
jgi:hypothetical protein